MSRKGRKAAPSCFLSALAGQQRRALTAWAAWQVIQLLRRRVTVELGFLADDHRLFFRLARVAHGRLLAGSIVSGWATTAGAATITTGTATVVGTRWAFFAAGATTTTALLAATTGLALATGVAALAVALTLTLAGTSTWAAIAALAFALVRADVVGTVTEVVYVVVQELFRIAVFG